MHRQFIFVPFGSRAPSAESCACDGLVPGAGLDLTHWQGNSTPAELKADTSTEIALIAAEREVAPVQVLNNHFDADGVLAVFTLLAPDVALRHREVMIAAAEAGDFDEWPNDDRGLRLEAAIAALAHGSDDAEAYEKVLDALPALLAGLEQRDDLWGEAWRALLADAARAADDVRVDRAGSLMVFHHLAGTRELAGPVLSRLAAPETNRWLLAFEEGDGRFRYRYELPRYAWADTVRRPRIEKPDARTLCGALGESWSTDGAGMTALVSTTRAIDALPARIAECLASIDADNGR